MRSLSAILLLLAFATFAAAQTPRTAGAAPRRAVLGISSAQFRHAVVVQSNRHAIGRHRVHARQRLSVPATYRR